ncbi:MAG: PEP-CTERM sorting domain-containing protein [Planctomycetota bacterium]
MMKQTAVLGVSALLFASSAGAAVITWGGGTGDFATGANWTGGSAPMLDGTDDAVISGGTATYTPVTDFGLGFAGSNITVSGGTLEQTVSNWWQFDGTGTFTVDGGTVNAGATNVQFGNTGTDSASLVISSGAFNHTGGGEVKIRGGNSLTITGGSLTTRFLGIGDFGVATVDVSGGSINLTDGSLFQGGLYTDNGSYINLTGAGEVNVADQTVASAIATYLDTDRIRVGGDVDNALLQVIDDGNGGVNISVVPEPGSLALLAIGGLLIARRRRG